MTVSSPRHRRGLFVYHLKRLAAPGSPSLEVVMYIRAVGLNNAVHQGSSLVYGKWQLI